MTLHRASVFRLKPFIEAILFNKPRDPLLCAPHSLALNQFSGPNTIYESVCTLYADGGHQISSMTECYTAAGLSCTTVCHRHVWCMLSNAPNIH